jgi:hypothetical protein
MTRRKKKELERQRQIKLQQHVLRRKKACDNKKTYDDLEHAEAWVDYYWKKFGDFLYPYLCRHCDKYHLTSKKPEIHHAETSISTGNS